MKELEFESELIQYITHGTITYSRNDVNAHEQTYENTVSYITKSKLWKYEPSIKTTDQLWNNFKLILEQHNQSTLDRPLSVVEFNQVKKIISDLKTPYQAGQFLYG